MKNFLLLSFIIIVSCSTPKENKQSEEEQLTEKFKELVTEHLESYKTDNRQSLGLLGGGWVKKEYNVIASSYDIQKTNSVVSPYVGICKFTLQRSYSDFFDTKEAALQADNLTQQDSREHIHKYSYQDNRWIITERNNVGSYGLTDCDEVISEGEAKGTDNIYGCWEKNF